MANCGCKEGQTCTCERCTCENCVCQKCVHDDSVGTKCDCEVE